MTFRGRLMFGASWLACRLPERPLFRVAGLRRRRVVPARPGPRRAGTPQPSPGVPGAGRDRTRQRTGPRRRDRPRRPRTPRPLRVPARGPVLPRGRPQPGDHPRVRRRAAADGHARPHRRSRRARARPSSSSGSISARSSSRSCTWRSRSGETVTPMETVDDPGLQAYFERTRGVNGVRLVGLKEARRDADRGVAQRHPGRARRRSGPDRRRHPDPAVRGARDAADGSRHARGRERRAGLRDDRAARRRRPLSGASSIPIDVPSTARAGSASTATMTRLAAAFEELIADAPDQWWAIFFPIWPDLERPATRPLRGGGMTEPHGATRSRRPPHPHRSPATGPRPSRRSSTTSSGGPTSTSSPSPTTSGSMPRWPAGRWPSTAGCAPRSSSARR